MDLSSGNPAPVKRMVPGDWEAIRYLLRHGRNWKRRRLVLDRYPELRGRTLKEIRALLAVHDSVMGKKRYPFWRKAVGHA